MLLDPRERPDNRSLAVAARKTLVLSRDIPSRDRQGAGLTGEPDTEPHHAEDQQ
jgi:hypothetical protein